MKTIQELVRQRILILDGALGTMIQKYNLSEEEALNITSEKSDVVYTRKLEALVEGKVYIDNSSNQMNQNDMLPEEEVLFNN